MSYPSISHRLQNLVLPVVLLTLVASAPRLCAQATSQPGDDAQTAAHTPGITVNARLVVLDVVATDKDGKPVDNLTAKDFQVYEDGKLQRIRSVEPPSAHALPAETLSAGANATFDPASPATFGRSPVNVLILDQLNTHFADSSFARGELHDYLAAQPALLPRPTTLLTVYDARFQQLQGFTRDRDLLLKALAAAPTKYAWKLELNGQAEYGPVERLDQSLRALEQIAQSYAGIPGRKNLIWVGGGFPTINPTLLDSKDAQEVKDTLQHVTDVLLDTRVTLYAVDPSSSAAGMTEITDESQQAFADAAGDTLSGSFDPFDSDENFDRLGPVTGGRVVRGRNDVSALIASSVDLGDHFYTLSYTPNSTVETAAKYRKIKIVCLRAGVTATTRSGYYSGQTQQEKTIATASYDLKTAAEGSMPLNGLHISIALDPNGILDTVRVSTPELTWKPRSDGTSVALVYVMAVSYNAKKKMLGDTVHPMKATAKAGTDLRDPKRLAEFSFLVKPLPKTTMLRFVVRDSATGRMGSMDLPLAAK